MSSAPWFPFGVVWKGRTPRSDPEHPSRSAALEQALKSLVGTPPRSVIVVGEPGVGAEGFAHELARRCKRLGDVLEAAPFQVNAGMSHIGELEARVESVVEASTSGRLTWLMAGFHEAGVAGAWQQDPHGLLGKLAAHMVEGRLRIVGATTPVGWAGVVRRRPELAAAVEVVHLQPLSTVETLAAARGWLAARPETSMDDDLLAEALSLVREHSNEALPGPLLRLIAAAAKVAAVAPGHGRDITTGHLLDALGDLTGLPRVLLDPAEPLDVDALRARFERRVVGQPEAVTALVERLTMAKAGLVDPTRPLAVLLFVGPTGTGKTELAKQLAEFVTGSSARLIRFDMSEFQGPGSGERLLGGEQTTGAGQGLVEAVAARRAAVVLLDEFEKAHPSVWDVFLQIFDDARATDAEGRVADFRHSMIVMTSNLGSGASASAPVGFGSGGEPAGAPAVDRARRAVDEMFRPEFVNRIDRVVAFRPLDRGVMRTIVRHELEALEGLRGLRTRPWAIEWDDSAVEALVREGFTPDMGARPLKRAIERHILAPLAGSIVSHSVPSGDQFLFVRAGADTPIEVQFVDPDGPPAAAPTVRPRADTPLASARAIARDPLGTVEEYEVLQTELDPVRTRIEGLSARKAQLLAEMARAGFWEDPDCRATLGEIERLDRLEAGLGPALGFSRRLAQSAGRAGAAELTRLLAQRVFLLGEELAAIDAGEPRDAWLTVRAVADGEAETATDAAAWPTRIGEMYRAWAHLRGMGIEEHRDGQGVLLEISGFAAYRLLRRETGLHVWESPGAGVNRVERALARVTCRPATDPRPAGDEPAPAVITRRYRERPSPLVRDHLTGWRTGRLTAVLGGAFDVIG